MPPIQLGQILTSRSGQQFKVIELTTAQELDDPDVEPDFFLAVLLPAGGDPARDSVELDTDEFKVFCHQEGIRY